MKIGFTGTQKGMSQRQISGLTRLILSLKMIEFHHGDCAGADSEAHDVVRNMSKDTEIVIHPPSNPSKRAFKKGDVTRYELPYLERNTQIVQETRLLIAAPSSLQEELRSGTWATIRYARKTGQPVLILDR